MGRALLAGWEKKNIFSSVTIIDPTPSEDLNKYSVFPNSDAVDKDQFDIVVLAVKPQIAEQVLPTLKRFAAKETLFVSIVTGKTIEMMSGILGTETTIVRTMPNTPAMIGQGMTACVADPKITPQQKQLADTLMRAVGDVVWLDDEEKMHAVTALSGSGPAYVFALIEAMQKAGEKMGLSSDLAAILARKTVEGSAQLAAQSDQTPEHLRKNVTSPNGTTEAALKVLLVEGGLDDLFLKALKAASQRSVELSS